MLGQRCRRWANIKPTLGERFLLSGLFLMPTNYDTTLAPSIPNICQQLWFNGVTQWSPHFFTYLLGFIYTNYNCTAIQL